MIGLLLSMALLGLLVWVIITYVPMPVAFRNAIIAIFLLLMILYVLGAIGFVDIAIPRIH